LINIGNDRNHLEREIRRAGVSYPRLLWVDLATMFHALHPEVGVNPKKLCKLSEACAFYGIPLGENEAHFALFDVLATARVLIRVCDEWVSRWLDPPGAIALTGHLGGGWDPTVLAAPIEPVRWRLPAEHRYLGRDVRLADLNLRYAARRSELSRRQSLYVGSVMQEEGLSPSEAELRWVETAEYEELRSWVRGEYAGRSSPRVDHALTVTKGTG
jgi:DNA polymerase III epsilon subunit-like protein